MFFFVWFGLSVFCCLFSSVEDIRFFAFHLFSYNLRTVDRPQDVLMTVRASSVHGMSYKKNIVRPNHRKIRTCSKQPRDSSEPFLYELIIRQEHRNL